MFSIQTFLFVAVLLATPSEAFEFEASACERQFLHECDTYFVNGFRAYPNNPDMKIYCGVFQQFADCISSSSYGQCKGQLIDSQRYMIYQQMIMDRTLNLCPHHDLRALKEIVNANEKYRVYVENLSGVDKDNFAPCAADIHHKCATEMQQKLGKGKTMYSSIIDFIKCYNSPERPCTAKIYTDFIFILNKFAPVVLQMYKASPGVMPDS